MKRFLVLLAAAACFLVLGCDWGTTPTLTTTGTPSSTENTSTSPSESTTTTTPSPSTSTTSNSTTTTASPTTSRTVTTTTSVISEIPAMLSTYASGVEFNAYRYNPPYRSTGVVYQVTFTSIVYSPNEKYVTLYFTVDDPGYRYANYFVVMEDHPGPYTEVLTRVYGNGTSHFSTSVSFSITDLSKTYRISFFKIDTDALDQSYPSLMQASAWVEWTDAHATERKLVSVTSHQETTPQKTWDKTGSEVDYDIVVSDPDNSIKSLSVEIFDKFGTVYGTQEFGASDIRSETGLSLAGKFEGLAPNAEYYLNVYISGNDGVDPFTKERLLQMQVQAAPYGDTPEDTLSYHSLYAFLYDVQYGATETVLSYVYKNGHVVKFADTNVYLDLHLEVWSKSGELMGTYPLETGDHQLTIPMSLLGPNCRFKITDQDGEYTFFLQFVPTLTPVIDLEKVAGSEYRIVLLQDYGNITGVQVQLRVKNFAVVLETITLPDVYTQPNFTFYHEWDSTVPVIITVTVTYQAYGEEYTLVFSK